MRWALVPAALAIFPALAVAASPAQGELASSVSAGMRALSSAPSALTALSLAPSASVVSCEVAPGGVCGRVVVPLNRREPAGAKIDIAYVLFRHSDTARPALGTIFVTQGGPGSAATNPQSVAASLSMFRPLLARRDLVLIDQRGVGRSRAINCPALQSFIGDIYALAAQCGAQLGASSDLYGSADVVRDIEAVRGALGVRQFDFYGASYAAMDAQAYAARFPGHLRSVVLDSPVVVPVEDPWQSLQPAQIVKTVALVCAGSALCSAASPDPVAELDWLAQRLRSQPVEGVGRDADGVSHNLRVTEASLVRMLQNESGSWLIQGEILAAARALRGGDPTPLLRLAAESYATLSGGPGSDPTVFSAGDNLARSCTDSNFQWNKLSTPTQRRVQFDQALAALDPIRFAPFSVAGWVVPAPLGSIPSACIGWPAPTHQPQPPVPTHTVIPHLPALVLTGELDLRVPPSESVQAARMFPDSSVVSVAESGHVTAFNEQGSCAQALINHFIDTMTAGDTSCARHASRVAPAVGSFPRRAAPQDFQAEGAAGQAASGKGASKDSSLRTRVAQIAVATLTDAFRRTFIQEQPAHQGVGLRGGTFRATEDSSGTTLHLAAARFAEDVAVTGDATYQGTLDANLSITGAARGTLHVHGIWNETGATRLTIVGQLDGQAVKTSVPAV